MKTILTLLAATLIIAAIPQQAVAKKTPKEPTVEQLKKIQSLKAAIETQNFVFTAKQVNTQIPRKPFVDLTNRENYVTIDQNTINSQLSYLGVSTMTYTDINSPLDFDSKINLYKISGDLLSKKGMEIKLETATKNNRLCKMIFYVYDNGTANLYVDATGFSRIVYRGEIIEKK